MDFNGRGWRLALPNGLAPQCRKISALRPAISLFFLAILAPACEKGDQRTKSQKQEDLTALLEVGRSVNMQPHGEQDSSLFLAEDTGSVVSLRRDANFGSISWVQYNTDQMPNVQKSQLRSHAEQFLRENSSDFGVSAEDLVPSGIRPVIPVTRSIDLVSYSRFYRDLPVRDAYVDFVFQKFRLDGEITYRLREVVNRSGFQIQVDNIEEPSVNFDQLVEATGVDRFIPIEAKDLILKVSVDGETYYTKATEYKVQDPEKANETFTITAEAGSGEIREAYSDVVSSAHHFVGNIFTTGVKEGSTEEYPLVYATVRDANNEKILLDADGNVDLGTASSTLLELFGPRVGVVDYAENKNVYKGFWDVDLNGETKFFDGASTEGASVNAYAAIQKINRFARRHLFEEQVQLLKFPIITYVNQDKGLDGVSPMVCNAFYVSMGSFITLAKEGSIQGLDCGNAALFNSIVYHEWGHALDDSTGRTGGMTDGAFSEGIGDILASYFSDDPKVARGFVLQSNQDIAARDLSIDAVYPDDKGEVHHEGTIIGSTFWDLRESLIERYGKEAGSYTAERLFFLHLLTTDTYLESYESVLRADDDDGNPNTKSPNHCLINQVFSQHGLATLEENCVDSDDDRGVPFDTNIKVGIESVTEGGKFKIMVSAPDNVEKVTACLDGWKACYKTANAATISFDRAESPENKRFFLSTDPVTLFNHSVVTILAEDELNVVVGIASKKLYSK